MLIWVLIFLALAITSGIFAFRIIVSASISIAKVLFFVFIAAFITSLIMYIVKM